MNKKMIGILFLALILTISWSAFAETPAEEEPVDTDQVEQLEEAVEVDVEEVVEQAEEPLESGIGWQLIRTRELGSTGKRVHMVLVEQAKYTDRTIYGNAITRLCADEEIFCRVRFWTQERFIPERISLTAEQHKQLKAEYTFDRDANVHQTLMSCSVDSSRVDCVP